MKKLQSGTWGGIAFLAVGLLFLGYSLMYPYKSEIGPGSGFFPLWISGLLVVLSVIYIYESAVGHDSAEAIEKEAMKKILLIVIYMVAYVLILPLAGFNITSFLFLFALLFKAYGKLKNAAISAVSTAAIYFLFLALGVQLPLNALGF
ncbi:MAG TPA: tripartite tricarboxylate transporter TctB family protein [Rectinemataceae bacterium]